MTDSSYEEEEREHHLDHSVHKQHGLSHSALSQRFGAMTKQFPSRIKKVVSRERMKSNEDIQFHHDKSPSQHSRNSSSSSFKHRFNPSFLNRIRTSSDSPNPKLSHNDSNGTYSVHSHSVHSQRSQTGSPTPSNRDKTRSESRRPSIGQIRQRSPTPPSQSRTNSSRRSSHPSIADVQNVNASNQRAIEALIMENRMLKEEMEGWRHRVESVSMEKEELSERHESLKLAVSEMTAQLRIMTRRYNKMRHKNEEYRKHLDSTLNVQMAKQQETIRNYHHQLVTMKEKYDIVFAQYLEKTEVIKDWKTKYQRLTLDFDQFINGDANPNGNGLNLNGIRVTPTQLMQRCKSLERTAASKEERLRHLARSIGGLYQDVLPLIGRHLEDEEAASDRRHRGDEDLDDPDHDEEDDPDHGHNRRGSRHRVLKESRHRDRNRSRRLLDDEEVDVMGSDDDDVEDIDDEEESEEKSSSEEEEERVNMIPNHGINGHRRRATVHHGTSGSSGIRRRSNHEVQSTGNLKRKSLDHDHLDVDRQEFKIRNDSHFDEQSNDGVDDEEEVASMADSDDNQHNQHRVDQERHRLARSRSIGRRLQRDEYGVNQKENHLAPHNVHGLNGQKVNVAMGSSSDISCDDDGIDVMTERDINDESEENETEHHNDTQNENDRDFEVEPLKLSAKETVHHPSPNMSAAGSPGSSSVSAMSPISNLSATPNGTPMTTLNMTSPAISKMSSTASASGSGTKKKRRRSWVMEGREGPIMVASNAANQSKMRTQNGQSTMASNQNGNGNAMNGHKSSKNGNASSSSGSSSSESMDVAPSPAPPPPEPSNMVLQSGLIEVNPSMETVSTKNVNDGQNAVNINVNASHQQRSKRVTMGNGQHHSNRHE